MSTRHRAARGEGISALAERYGFFPDTLWDHPDNQALRELRRHPNQLVEGDVVAIPEKRSKSVAVATGRRHKFRRRGIPSICRIQLLAQGEPRKGEPFTVEIGTVQQRGMTDDLGVARFTVQAGAQRARLRLTETGEEVTIHFAELYPVEERRGVLQRLRNLGFYAGDVDGLANEETSAAIRTFQEHAGLAVTGEADDATRERLRELHDTPERLRLDGEEPNVPDAHAGREAGGARPDRGEGASGVDVREAGEAG